VGLPHGSIGEGVYRLLETTTAVAFGGFDRLAELFLDDTQR
jgi:hypothetical protein